VPIEAQLAAQQASSHAYSLKIARRVFQRGGIHATLMGPLDRANMKRNEKPLLGFSGRR